MESTGCGCQFHKPFPMTCHKWMGKTMVGHLSPDGWNPCGFADGTHHPRLLALFAAAAFAPLILSQSEKWQSYDARKTSPFLAILNQVNGENEWKWYRMKVKRLFFRWSEIQRNPHGSGIGVKKRHQFCLCTCFDSDRICGYLPCALFLGSFYQSTADPEDRSACWNHDLTTSFDSPLDPLGNLKPRQVRCGTSTDGPSRKGHLNAVQDFAIISPTGSWGLDLWRDRNSG